MWKVIFNFIFKGQFLKLMWKGGKNNGEEDGSLNWNNYDDFYNHPLKTMKLFIPLWLYHVNEIHHMNAIIPFQGWIWMNFDSQSGYP
jgi:hypothetical protein